MCRCVVPLCMSVVSCIYTSTAIRDLLFAGTVAVVVSVWSLVTNNVKNLLDLVLQLNPSFL
jgi:hypothetical protein